VAAVLPAGASAPRRLFGAVGLFFGAAEPALTVVAAVVAAAGRAVPGVGGFGAAGARRRPTADDGGDGRAASRAVVGAAVAVR
jgi:hypothetical protein